MRSVASTTAAVIVLGLGMMAGASPAAADSDTPFIDLGALSGATNSQALLVNNHGVVAGLSSTGTDTPYGPSRWNRAARLTMLPVLPEARFVELTALNDSSEIIGQETTTDGRQLALRWKRGGSVTELQSQPATSIVIATAINRSGTIVGSAGNDTYSRTLLRWDRTGRSTELPKLPGMRRSWVTAINDRGTVVGYGNERDSLPIPGFWDRSGTPHLLEVPPDLGGAHPTDINNHGFIVGGRIVWDPAGHPTVLPGDGANAQQINERDTVLGFVGGTLARWRNGLIQPLSSLPDSYGATAIAENDDDIAIGTASLSPGSRLVPIWWDRRGAVHRLACPTPEVAGYSCAVVAINNLGFAVGYGAVTDAEGVAHSHALVWKLRP